jgi:hypothetical protein
LAIGLAVLTSALLSAIGLSDGQQKDLSNYVQVCVQQYRAYAEGSARIIGGAETLPPATPEIVQTNANSRVWMIPQLAEKVADWKGQFEKGIAALIGPERAQVLLQQAANDYSLERVFQDFGANEPMMVVTPLANGRCALAGSFFRRGRRLSRFEGP